MSKSMLFLFLLIFPDILTVPLGSCCSKYSIWKKSTHLKLSTFPQVTRTLSGATLPVLSTTLMVRNKDYLKIVELMNVTVVTAGRSRKSKGFWKGQADQLWWRILSIRKRTSPDIDIDTQIQSVTQSANN